MNFINIFGFGTILYGSRDKNKDDNSYTTTGWITLLYFPVIPLGSYRVILEKQHGIIVGARTNYQKMEKIQFNKQQIINTYLLWYLPVLAVVLFFWWLSFQS